MVAAINLAVPMLAASALRPTASALVWIVDTYVIVFACLVIPGGAAGDRFGRTGVLLAGLLLFAVGVLLSAVAPNVAVVLAGRAITGVGAAAVLPNTLAVLPHAVPAERRGARRRRPVVRVVAPALPCSPGSSRAHCHRPGPGSEPGCRPPPASFRSALGFAVIGTVLTSRFVAELPPDIRAGHDPHTGAQALAAIRPDRAPDAVAAFVTAADAGLRVIGWSVLVIGGLVLLESLLSRRLPVPA
jgi:hypothetical protein